MKENNRWWCFWDGKVYDHTVSKEDAFGWLANQKVTKKGPFVIPEEDFDITVYSAFEQLKGGEARWWITLPDSVWNNLKKKGERG